MCKRDRPYLLVVVDLQAFGGLNHLHVPCAIYGRMDEPLIFPTHLELTTITIAEYII